MNWSIFGRRVPMETPATDRLLDETLQRMVAGAKARHYRDGMVDGIKLSMESLLDICDVNGGVGNFRGALTPELETWARDVLARAQEGTLDR